MSTPSPPASRSAVPLVTVLLVLALAVGVVSLVLRAPGSQAALPTTAPTAAAQPVTPPSPASRPGTASRLSTFWGVDISWPQCDMSIPPLDAGFVTVGVNGGRPFTDNPCLAEQVAYAKRHSGYAAYLNLAAPRGTDPTTYGRQSALDGLARARAAGLRVHTLWLDVEVLNHWSTDPTVNVAVVNGAVAALRAEHVTAGIYSSVPMWQQIAGGGRINMPVWLATSVTDYRALQPLCRTGLGGHPAAMAQYVAAAGGQLIDVDVLCDNAVPDVVGMFAAAH